MIGLALLAMMQVSPSDRIAFVCQDDRGETFSLLVPAVIEEGVDPDPAAYSIESLDVPGMPGDIFDDLPEQLELHWSPADKPQVTLQINGYDVVGRTASYRLRRESPPDTAISWSSFSSGQCLGRRIAGDTADAPEEGNSR